jgi:hypothetical protein
MLYMKITASTTIEVLNHRALREAWRDFDPLARMCIKRFAVEKALTPAQIRRLPSGLRARLA